MEKAKLQERYQLFIGGQWKDASDHETFKTICPADGPWWPQPISTAPTAGIWTSRRTGWAS